MDIPTKKSWGDNHLNRGFDYADAYEKFNGLTFNEAERLFKNNALNYQELLYYMPQKPFEYYYLAYQKYILSKEAEGDCDGASSFIDNVFDFIEADWIDLSENFIAEMLEAASYVSKNQNFFDAPTNIYGDFTKRFHKRLNKLNKNRV